jgi:hypothetical protein
MDLNAYVLAMAIASVPRHKKNRQTIPEPEFKPFDLGTSRAGLRTPARHNTVVARERGRTMNLKLYRPEASVFCPSLENLRESDAISRLELPHVSRVLRSNARAANVKP